jgi:hypothetical protein
MQVFLNSPLQDALVHPMIKASEYNDQKADKKSCRILEGLNKNINVK